MSNVGQDFGAAMLFAGNVAEPGGLEQAAELAGQNRGFRRQILVKEVVDGIVQKRHRPNHFVRYQQRGRQQRARAVLLGGGESRGLHLVAKNRPPLADCLGRNRTLFGTHAQTDKPFGQFAVGLFAHQFVPGLAAPEIDSGDAKELSGSAAEQLDQGLGVGPLSRLGSNTEQQLLERVIRARDENRVP